jgi:hypothetical protein
MEYPLWISFFIFIKRGDNECGRFTLVAEPEAIMDWFGLDSIPFEMTKKI